MKTFSIIWIAFISLIVIFLFVIFLSGNIDFSVKAFEEGWGSFSSGIIGSILVLIAFIITLFHSNKNVNKQLKL